MTHHRRSHVAPRADWDTLSPAELVNELRAFMRDHRRYMRRHRLMNIGAYILVVAVATVGAWQNGQTRTAAERSNAIAIAKIQAERVRSILVSCEQTNARNLQTKREVRARIPHRAAQFLTLELVDALMPYVADCHALAELRAPSRPGR